MRRSHFLFLAASAGLALVAGCSIPIPQAAADPTKFFVLSTAAVPASANATGATTASAAPAAATVSGAIVHLREVEIASYLRARPLVVRHGENQIEFREFSRWGEPLEQGIARVLREELLASGAASAVVAPGLRAARLAPTCELSVRVLSCEGTVEGTVNFHATWELLAVGGTKPEIMARGDYRAPGLRWDEKSEAQLVARLSEAVAGLATEISTALKK